MATRVDEDLRQGLESFWQSAPREHREAIERFLATKPPMTNPSSVIPPAEEAQIRLDLARKLQDAIRKVNGLNSWMFNASHLGIIFVMPMDILKQIASTGKVPHLRPGAADLQLQRASDLIKECKFTRLWFSVRHR